MNSSGDAIKLFFDVYEYKLSELEDIPKALIVLGEALLAIAESNQEIAQANQEIAQANNRVAAAIEYLAEETRYPPGPLATIAEALKEIAKK